MPSGGAAPQPTFKGHVATTQDALILFEACLQGHLSHVLRRPRDRERSSLIRSGYVFVYEENASGIKRWTDGVTWSPSRILGNFLVYRELDKKFSPGDKRRAIKKNTYRPNQPREPCPSPRALENDQRDDCGGSRTPSEVERQLIGSLIDSYDFEANGLIKKTMSLTLQGGTYHLVSYYKIHDVIANNLRQPSQIESLQYIRPRSELTLKQIFRSPIEQVDELGGIPRDGYRPYGSGMSPKGFVQNYPAPCSMARHYPTMSQAPAGRSCIEVPPMLPSYMQTNMIGKQLPSQRPRNGRYDQAGHKRSFDSFNRVVSKSISPTSMVPRSDEQHTMMDPSSNLQTSITSSDPVPLDSSIVAYRSSPYIDPGHSPRGSHQSSRPPPVPMKCEDRHESRQRPGLVYDTASAPFCGHRLTPQINQATYSQTQSTSVNVSMVWTRSYPTTVVALNPGTFVPHSTYRLNRQYEPELSPIPGLHTSLGNNK